jgi:hypothetical protein
MKRVAWVGLIMFSLLAGTRIVRAEAPPLPGDLAAPWFQNPGAIDPRSTDLQFIGNRCNSGGGGGYSSYRYYSGYGGGSPGYGYSPYGNAGYGFVNPYAYQSMYMGIPSRQVYSTGYWGQFPNMSNFNSYYYNSYRPSPFPYPRTNYYPGGGGHHHCR